MICTDQGQLSGILQATDPQQGVAIVSLIHHSGEKYNKLQNELHFHLWPSYRGERDLGYLYELKLA